MMCTYLKLGAEASSRPRHARFVAAYERRKKTEASGEIAFSDPMSSTNCDWKTVICLVLYSNWNAVSKSAEFVRIIFKI